MLETMMSKRRILEIYLNVIEWGKVYSAREAAARYHFEPVAANLSLEQAHGLPRWRRVRAATAPCLYRVSAKAHVHYRRARAHVPVPQ
jgi:membrane carboxypeptidase/penicillin-binding protein